MQRILRAAAIALLIAATAVAADAPSEWDMLMRGNRAYVDGMLVYSHLAAIRRATADHQDPHVTIVSCSDSRVPPELMFNQTVGDLFVIRVAGNVVDTFNLASVEYAVANGYTRTIVVIGHENCGAVKEAISNKTEFGSDSLNDLVKKIRANLQGKKPPLKEAVEMNARASTKQLLDESKIIRDKVNAGTVKIVTAYYSFDGKVVRLD